MTDITQRVAERLKDELGYRMFKTLPPRTVLVLWREESKSPSAKTSSGRLAEVEEALLDQGVRCVPHLSSQVTVRLIRAGSPLSRLYDWLANPSLEGDRELARILTKIAGRWQWSGPTPSPGGLS